jgi:CHAT domain-containing protein
LGLIYNDIGQHQESISFFEKALSIAKQIGDQKEVGNSLNFLGVAYSNVKQPPKALESYQQALAVSRSIGNRQGEREILNNMGFLLSQQNQVEAAILFYKQSVNVTESIRKDIRGLSKDEQNKYLATVARTYRRLGDLLLQRGRVMEALQIIDLLKIQELEDYLKNVKGNERTAEGVRFLAPEKEVLSHLPTISFEKLSEFNRLLSHEIQQLPQSEINKVPTHLQKLPQGVVLIYPLILSDRLELILFSANSFPVNRTVKVSRAKLDELITEFKAGLLDAGSEDFREPAKELYNLLIKPIEKELIQAKTETILYAPDGILRYVPLAALYDGKQWLIEKYRISNLISYSLSDFVAKQKVLPSILAGAFGGKGGERKFGQTALPATLKEVAAIANSFQNSTTLEEEQFSRQAIESQFKNYHVLHLATHAEFNIGAPEKSFIIFGNGDRISLNEITDWQIPNVELIVLSACQTGTGTLENGVEILGFGYQVQKAGAKNAIASLWKVDDAGTQSLMAAFYKELQNSDISVTEALRKAQISLIKSSKFNHPNYWSAFFAISNGL